MAAPSQSEHHDVAVVGGGVIGLAVAWRAAQRGLRTLVLDAGEDGAWRYAAGMLAPVTEAEFGEDALLGARPARARRLPRLLRRAGGRAAPRGHARRRARPRRGRGARAAATSTASRSASRSSACARARRAAPSPRSRRRSGSRSTCPATPPSTRAASSPRWPRRSSAPGGEIRRERVTDLTTLPADQVVVAAGAWSGRARRDADPARQGPDHAPARPRGPGPRHAHDPHPRGLPRPARRGPLRARRDRRGARLGHRADERRDARADPRPRRGRAGRARARDRGARRRPAARDARQPAGHRLGRRRSCGRPATTATGSCSPTSPPRRSCPCSPATACRSGRRLRPARGSRRCRRA